MKKILTSLNYIFTSSKITQESFLSFHYGLGDMFVFGSNMSAGKAILSLVTKGTFLDLGLVAKTQLFVDPQQAQTIPIDKKELLTATYEEFAQRVLENKKIINENMTTIFMARMHAAKNRPKQAYKILQQRISYLEKMLETNDALRQPLIFLLNELFFQAVSRQNFELATNACQKVAELIQPLRSSCPEYGMVVDSNLHASKLSQFFASKENDGFNSILELLASDIGDAKQRGCQLSFWLMLANASTANWYYGNKKQAEFWRDELMDLCDKNTVSPPF